MLESRVSDAGGYHAEERRSEGRGDVLFSRYAAAARIRASRAGARAQPRHASTNSRNGVNGFRAWFWDEDKMSGEFMPCQCGWAPKVETHYARDDFVAGERKRARAAKRKARPSDGKS